jgi:threonine synthase
MANGIVKSVSEQELTEIGREADRSGLFVCPHTAVALGGVRQALDDSTIKAGESVVVVATAHGLKFTEFKTATAENKVDGATLDSAALPIEVDNRYEDVLRAALDE